ncbi:hypothetical protein [Ramlibacter rhizophilus]|uniref:Cyclic nucleotide-binding domain-containing protein n=1 Tax=Ramlibacter rhizophilus TaxID=1781167 RepID=A0A4Z0BVC4_9BURK|nr:hypothetical protein [Ramlibacter rhizophilus]TFZ03266.1 hypothetical protein EZ242_05085 [Ramlibacter rhizophilus]
MSDPAQRTRYFTVVDESGRAEPVVEFWASTAVRGVRRIETDPLRRFVQLLATGEYLREEVEGVYVEGRTGRKLFAVASGA